MARREEVLQQAVMLQIPFKTDETTEVIAKKIDDYHKEQAIKAKIAFEDKLKEEFDWVDYKKMEERVHKGDILKEVHVFNGNKMYGFVKPEKQKGK